LAIIFVIVVFSFPVLVSASQPLKVPADWSDLAPRLTGARY
jgi:hypothetical protein